MKKFAPLCLLLIGNEIISLLVVLYCVALFAGWLLGEAAKGGFFD